jgi:hypothetical protein
MALQYSSFEMDDQLDHSVAKSIVSASKQSGAYLRSGCSRAFVVATWWLIGLPVILHLLIVTVLLSAFEMPDLICDKALWLRLRKEQYDDQKWRSELDMRG